MKNRYNSGHLDRFYEVGKYSDVPDNLGRPSRTLVSVGSGYCKILGQLTPKQPNELIPDDTRVGLRILTRYNDAHRAAEVCFIDGRRYRVTGYHEDITQPRRTFGILTIEEDLNP